MEICLPKTTLSKEKSLKYLCWKTGVVRKRRKGNRSLPKASQETEMVPWIENSIRCLLASDHHRRKNKKKNIRLNHKRHKMRLPWKWFRE